MFTRQQYLNKECTHQQYYAQFVTEYIKTQILTVFTPAELKASTDPYMNDLPRARWDLIVNSTTPTSKLKEACKPHNVSQSDINSVVKEAARQLQQELNNQPKKVQAMNGILQKLEATANDVIAKDALLFRKQKYTTPWRTIGTTKCRAFIRFDDECGNGHNSFAITGETREFYDHKWHEGSSGCVHEEVAEFFPELAPFIMWHLTSSDGPMHYIANTKYHASDKDCWGRRAGEPDATHKAIRPHGSPFTRKVSDGFLEFINTSLASNLAFEIVEVPHLTKPGNTFDYSPQYTFKGFDKAWAYCPFSTLAEAQEMLAAVSMSFTVETVVDSYSKGKPRDLEAARNCACWPDATDEELCSDNLEELLKARHAPLMQKFKDAMQELGLLYQPQPESQS